MTDLSDAQTRDGTTRRRTGALTPTSFAVLGLLAMQDWSTYELAQQMQRSFSYFWPRAERRIYDEPKRLAAAGYVEGRREVVGRRPRTTWTITPSGRTALHEWLDREETSAPAFEFEGMLKIFLSDGGDRDQLLDNLAQVHDSAADRSARLAQMCAELAATEGGSFPGRAHINALAMDYVLTLNEMTAQWARRSAEIVRDWESTTDPGEVARNRAIRYFADRAEDTDRPVVD